jgi:serine/threonine protein kinase
MTKGKDNPLRDGYELEQLLGVPGGRLKQKIHRDAAATQGGLLTSKELFGDIIEELAEDAPGAPASPGPAEPSDPTTQTHEAAPAEPAPAERKNEPAPAVRGSQDTAPSVAVAPPAPSPPEGSQSLIDVAYSALLQDDRLRGELEGRREADSAQPAPSAAPVGYGQYELLERIAIGGMAEVFRAKRQGVEGFEKVVAVKRILPSLSSNKDFIEMFVNEAKMAASLSHPNIANIFELGKIEDTYFIAMEFVDGRDLRAVLSDARERGVELSMDLAALIVSRVASALGYAHRQKGPEGQELKIVHRDVSPQNVLISYEGEVKLVDFGIAKAAVKAPTTDSGSLRGKLLYMSPEQAWGKAVDKRSDLFSLGVVFFELLTGQSPFMGSSELSILEMVRAANVPAPSSFNPVLPGQLEAVVMQALRKDPAGRYQDASEMLQDLDAYLRGRPAVGAAELAAFMRSLYRPEGTTGSRPDKTDPALTA